MCVVALCCTSTLTLMYSTQASHITTCFSFLKSYSPSCTLLPPPPSCADLTTVTQLIETALPKLPRIPGVTAHWLAINGVQPDLPENVSAGPLPKKRRQPLGLPGPGGRMGSLQEAAAAAAAAAVAGEIARYLDNVLLRVVLHCGNFVCLVLLYVARRSTQRSWPPLCVPVAVQSQFALPISTHLPRKIVLAVFVEACGTP